MMHEEGLQNWLLLLMLLRIIPSTLTTQSTTTSRLHTKTNTNTTDQYEYAHCCNCSPPCHWHWCCHSSSSWCSAQFENEAWQGQDQVIKDKDLSADVFSDQVFWAKHLFWAKRLPFDPCANHLWANHLSANLIHLWANLLYANLLWVSERRWDEVKII